MNYFSLFGKKQKKFMVMMLEYGVRILLVHGFDMTIMA